MHGVRISMDGTGTLAGQCVRGASLAFSLKQEQLYRRSYESVTEFQVNGRYADYSALLQRKSSPAPRTWQ